MVHGNVGQSDLTREDMTRYIRYLVDVIGNEQKALYSYLEDRTNPYICLHGECQTFWPIGFQFCLRLMASHLHVGICVSILPFSEGDTVT